MNSSLDSRTYDVMLMGMRTLQINTLQSLKDQLRARMLELPRFLRRAITNLQQSGTPVTFSIVRTGLSVNILMTYLIALKGDNSLRAFYEESTTFGVLGPILAEKYALAAREVQAEQVHAASHTYTSR